MQYLRYYLVIFLAQLFIFHGAHKSNQEPVPVQIVKQMIDRTRNITSMTFNMKKKERIKGKYPFQETDVKLNVKPFKIYLRQKSPKNGLEVLYVQDRNHNKALVNTNGFPWVNVHLDPMGSTMRNNQHHTIFQSGYTHLMSILDHLTIKYKNDIDDVIKITGSVQWDNKSCWIIVFDNPDFKYVNYTAQKGDDVLKIAHNMKLSEHMIMELNNLSSYELAPGKTLIIPNDYSSRLELYVDKLLFIPLVMKVFDNKGLYEYYEYTDVKINPGLTDTDFKEDNPEYGF